MEKMPHDDAACSCLAAALHELLILGKRRPSPLCTSLSWKGQTALLCLCLGCTPWRMEKMPPGEALTATDGDGGIRLVSPSSAENVGGSAPYL
jgi:hypothetical protein